MGNFLLRTLSSLTIIFSRRGGTHINSGSSDIDGIYGAFTLYGQEVSHGLRPHTQSAYLEEASSITFAIGDLVGELPLLWQEGW